MNCAHPDCSEPHVAFCDVCDVPFCEDHGTKGGDRPSHRGEFMEAYPSICWQDGGFNADE
jgi:hypothetical protein